LTLSPIWNNEIRAELESLLSGPAGLACSDFDNTLIRGDLGESTMFYILLHGLIGADLDEFWSEIRHPVIAPALIEKWRNLWHDYADSENEESYQELAEGLIETYHKIAENHGLEGAYRWTRVLYCGMSESELGKIAKHVFMESQLDDISPIIFATGIKIDTSIRIREPFRELLREMKSRHWEIHILTASPEYIIQTAMPEFGLEPTSVRGMRLRQNDRILMPTIIEPMTFDQGKIDALREITNRPVDFAAGDSFTDLGMLKAAKLKLLVDRGNARLRDLAKSEGWLIQTAESLDRSTG